MANSVVPNVAMQISGGVECDTRRRPQDVRPVMVENIIVAEDRKRQIDDKKVEEIRESIRELGLLQPIGVRAQHGKPFQLIYGHHRLLAKLQLMESDPTQDVIAAVIYPEDMPDWACELNEIAENLFRKELMPKECQAHTTMYAGLLKLHGNVVEGRKAQGQTQANGARQKSLASSPPTVTRKIAADLGISDVAVRNRVRNASKLAARIGITVVKPTPEAMSGEQLVEVGKAALKVAEADRAEAAKDGKSPLRVKPHQPTKATITTVRLDVTDPKPFIDWCRTRIAGKHKPMSIDILKTYATALAALITEVEAAP
jgi:hypothetical protein